ncbi:ABC-2 type transport system permease protein [Staphylococcus epidermidis]|uniref:ABC transporter permease n=1 Tax=Staphylococcus epidermidis TaxID=1282 RepID=UPI00138ACCA6|nr:ABC transporter permease [Staphylococcus epidermidis]MBM6228460.1 ABC transporter permease [Staphylococcus epidermidis]MBM6233087.1 ABC transporter permease [Staphylococcus epidermidis]MBM6235376.1 ABC transporter permease [Staphylococcus epidermidis]MBM6237685.1 ABC transporter permease [Staphylococcus epidermidis]MBM6239986.1 ABC transporter permease [Staphylococcus epidermidis]
MYKFFSSFNFTYINKLKSIPFIIITAILSIGIILLFNSDKIEQIFTDEKKIEIKARNDIYNKIEQSLKKEDSNFTITKSKTSSEFKNKLKKGKIDYHLNVNLSQNNQLKVELDSLKAPNPKDYKKIENSLLELQKTLNIQNSNLTKGQLNQLNKSIDINTNTLEAKIDKNINSKEQDFQLAFTYLLIIVLMFIIMTYVNQMAMEVATEKTSRVIEMIVTSITPKQHIISKLLAIISIAITQILILTVITFICWFAFGLNGILDNLDLKITYKSTNIILLGLLYWIIGIISYILLASILGSLASRMEEVGQVVMPIILIMIVGFYIAVFNFSTPDSKIVKVASYLPLVSPFTMPLRMANFNLSNSEIIMSLLISIIFIVIFFIIAISTFKNSVLTFNKKNQAKILLKKLK